MVSAEGTISVWSPESELNIIAVNCMAAFEQLSGLKLCCIPGLADPEILFYFACSSEYDTDHARICASS